jgi:two-component system NtrC family response regulator
VPVHCASFQENLLESELFGHEKGAFTGAIARRLGRFELADKGTLFLDEVSTIPLSIQVKLLRVLQERVFERVGGTETIETNVRIVAATNTSLEELIEEGKFREDLYYRLNVVSLKVPPLRARPEDIKLLIKHFLEKFNRETGKNIIVSPFAEEILESYAWPGNVRELQNTIESLVVLCQGHEITPRDLPQHILGATNRKVTKAADEEVPDFDNITLAEIEKWIILRKLEKIKNKSEIAKQLGISRRNLYRRLNEYGVMEKK